MRAYLVCMILCSLMQMQWLRGLKGAVSGRGQGLRNYYHHVGCVRENLKSMYDRGNVKKQMRAYLTLHAAVIFNVVAKGDQRVRSVGVAGG